MSGVIASGPEVREAIHRVPRTPPSRLLRALCALAMTVLFAGCASPEAGRLPGGAGADVKNWGSPVQFHAGAQPYHDTRCVTDRVECHGPLPVFGQAPSPE